MISFSIERIDAKALAQDVRETALRAQRRVASEVEKEHRSLIDGGDAPAGGAQRPNSRGWRIAKGGKPPLLNTGRLRAGLRVRKLSDGSGFEVLPPADRVEAIKELQAAGYSTVFDTVPDGLAGTAQAIVSEETSKIDVTDHIKRSGSPRRQRRRG